MSNDVSDTQSLLQSQLLQQIDRVVSHLLPNGEKKETEWHASQSIDAKEHHFIVQCSGKNAGRWIEKSKELAGDLLSLWAIVNGFDARFELAAIFHSIKSWLNENISLETLAALPHSEIDKLGEPINQWVYLDEKKNILACLFEFKPAKGRILRPWHPHSQSFRLPYPRPLYQLPRIKTAQHVVIVENEINADLLTEANVVGTTAMLLSINTVDKVDWRPLATKQVIVWSTNDKKGRSLADKTAQAAIAAGAQTVQIVSVINKPPSWCVQEAVADGLDLIHFLNQSPKQNVSERKNIKTFSLDDLLEDQSPVPDDLIAPRLLTPQGLLVIGGAPKVGKSDFILTLITHMAAGETFLIFNPPRPLRVFYLQAEVHYHYLRERIKLMQLPDMIVWKASDNLIITPNTNITLNDEGMTVLERAILRESEAGLFDIIVIDPLRNVFDGGTEMANENDNSGMLYFLKNRIDVLRQKVNPEAGVILVHHTRKLSKKQLLEEPFDAFSGASSLRSYYTSGAIFYRPDTHKSTRAMMFELRNGPSLPLLHVDKENGQWIEIDVESQRLINPDYGQKLDAERRRKHDIILQIVFDEAAKGKAYTINQFAECLEGKAGLGGERSIRERLGVLATQGYVKFFQNYDRYRLKNLTRSKFGYICVEGMQFLLAHKTNQPELTNGANPTNSHTIPVYPTHYKCPHSGAALPVENPNIWHYQEEDNHESNSHPPLF